MTQSRKSTRAQTRRREEEWLAAYWRHEAHLQSLPDRDLDALVADRVFQHREPAAVPSSTSWDGLGRIVEHLHAHGYTLHLSAFEPLHLDWLKQSHPSRGCQTAEVTVVDFRSRRLPLPQGWPNLLVKADTLPRAAAIAAVLAAQIEKGIVAPPLPQPEEHTPKTDWSEERRRQKSEQMKAYWQRKRAAHAGAATTAQPTAEE
jgi:hypothetical protein